MLRPSSRKPLGTDWDRIAVEPGGYRVEAKATADRAPPPGTLCPVDGQQDPLVVMLHAVRRLRDAGKVAHNLLPLTVGKSNSEADRLASLRARSSTAVGASGTPSGCSAHHASRALAMGM